MFKFAAVLLLLSWPASAEDRLYYRFSQWAGLQEDDRAAYISDLLDTLAMAATEPAQRTAQHRARPGGLAPLPPANPDTAPVLRATVGR